MRLIRCYSIKSIPFEAKPANKYNAVKSAYNFKPRKPTQGLVYNPPASMVSVSQTPKAFLPHSDPRKNLGIQKEYSTEEINDMPVIHGTTKKYDVDEKTALEILNLRSSDPTQWTISKLCKKFNVSPYFVINISKSAKPSFPAPAFTKRQTEQNKRVSMWLRNEF